jgi:hypothetical protein
LVSLRSTSKESSLEEIQSRRTPARDIYHRVVFRIPHRFTGARIQSLALSRLRATGVQLSLQDTAGIKLKLGDPAWATVVATLGALLDTQTKALRYDRKKSDTLRRSFFREIRTKRGG